MQQSQAELLGFAFLIGSLAGPMALIVASAGPQVSLLRIAIKRAVVNSFALACLAGALLVVTSPLTAGAKASSVVGVFAGALGVAREYGWNWPWSRFASSGYASSSRGLNATAGPASTNTNTTGAATSSTATNSNPTNSTTTNSQEDRS